MVAFDTSALTNGNKVRGVGVYTTLLLEALEKYASEVKVKPFQRGKSIPKEADIIHYTYFDPFNLDLPTTSSYPRVVTVHDLIPLVFPDKFPSGVRGFITWQIQRIALRNCDRIITDSQCSKSDIARIVPYPEDNIDVVYLASHEDFKVNTNPDEIKIVKKKYSIVKPFFLYVGDVNWNKNVTTLIDAYAYFREKYSLNADLALVGGSFLSENLVETQQINHIIKEHKLEKYIHRLGHITRDELRSLYVEAVALIQPSFYEGFGLPIIEAMTSGGIVIASEGGSLKEVVGPSIRIEATKMESMVEAMDKAMNMTAQERTNYKKKAAAWVSQFSWKRVAAETIQSYEKSLINAS